MQVAQGPTIRDLAFSVMFPIEKRGKGVCEDPREGETKGHRGPHDVSSFGPDSGPGGLSTRSGLLTRQWFPTPSHGAHLRECVCVCTRARTCVSECACVGGVPVPTVQRRLHFLLAGHRNSLFPSNTKAT